MSKLPFIHHLQSEYTLGKKSHPIKALNADIIRYILEQQLLKFSDKAIRLIVKASEQYQSNLGKQNNLTVSERREQLEAVKTTATQLSSILKKWAPYLETEREDKTLSTLDRLIRNCDKSLDYYKKEKSNGGAPLKSGPLKLFVQLLILTYEEETDSVYIIKERSKGNRDRAQYDKKVHNFVKSILKHVVPDSNHEELIKAARREPLSLAWTRKMKGNLDEYFRNERSRDQRRAVALKKKLVNKGFQLM